MTTAVEDRTVETFAANANGKNTYMIPEELNIVYESPADWTSIGESPGLLTMEEISTCLEAAGFDVEAESAKAAKSMRALAMFRIMTPKDGDKRVTWRRNSIPEIRAAKKMFMDLHAQGMQAFKVGVDGKASVEMMKEFDPYAEEVVFMPLRAIAGG